MSWDPTAFSEFEGEFQDEAGHSDTEQEQYRARVASADRQLTVKRRSIIRKYFTETAPVQLPARHTNVGFNEDQIHTIFRTIADESVISSYHLMKSLLLHATSGVSQDHRIRKGVYHDVVPPRLAQCMIAQDTKVVLGGTLLTVILVGHSIQMKILVS